MLLGVYAWWHLKSAAMTRSNCPLFTMDSVFGEGHIQMCIQFCLAIKINLL